MSAPASAPAARLALIATAGAAVIVPLAYFPPLEAPFVVPKMAALLIAAALAFVAFSLHRVARPGARLIARPVAVGLVLVMATTLASWAVAVGGPAGTPYALAATARWAALFGIACGAVIVAREQASRKTLLEAVTVAASVVSVLGLCQHFNLASLPIPVISAPGSTFGNRNFGGETIALSLPLGVAALVSARVEGRRTATRLLAGALLLQLLYLAATRTRGAWFGAAVGLTAFFALWRPRLSRAVVGAGIGAVVLAGVVAVVPGPLNKRDVGDAKRYASGAVVAESSFDPHSPAIHERIGIWRRAAAMWREHPIWGVGPGNWQVWFPYYAEPGALQDRVLTVTVVARQAHDDLLERGGETGAVGVAALLVLAIAAGVAVRRRARAADPGVRVSAAAGGGALAALVGCGVTGFPLEMPGTLTLAGVALGLAAAAAPSETTVGAMATASVVRRLARQATVALSAVLLLAAGVAAKRQVLGSYWLGEGVRALRRDHGAAGGRAAEPALERARNETPGSYHVWLRLAHAATRMDDAQAAAEAAQRALAIEPWAPNAWATVAAAQLQAGDPVAAHASATRALTLLHDLPHALMIDAQATAALGEPRAATQAREHLRALAQTPSSDKDTIKEARDIIAHLDYRAVDGDRDKGR
jgi:O-antigen ligase